MPFETGTVVQLKSGGPLMTVALSVPNDLSSTALVYFNSVSGLFEKITITGACLREANTRPESPVGGHGHGINKF